VAAADVSRGFVALFRGLLFVALLLFANILLITELVVRREGTGVVGGGTVFEFCTHKVPGANPGHLTYGRMRVEPLEWATTTTFQFIRLV
jgi:hypothetical protein